MNATNWLDFDGDADNEADAVTFKGILYHCGSGIRPKWPTQRIMHNNARGCRRINYYEFVLTDDGMRCLTSSKPFDFGADPDHDPGVGILKGIFLYQMRDRNYACPVALAEFRHLGRELLIFFKFFFALSKVSV